MSRTIEILDDEEQLNHSMLKLLEFYPIFLRAMERKNNTQIRTWAYHLAHHGREAMKLAAVVDNNLAQSIRDSWKH